MPPVDALPQTNASKETIRSDENLSRDLHHPKIKGERLRKAGVYKLMRVEGRASNVLGEMPVHAYLRGLRTLPIDAGRMR